MLVFESLYDVIMLSWFSVLFFATIYKCKSCFSDKGKQSDDFSNLDKKEEFTPKFVKSTKSYSNFTNIPDFKYNDIELEDDKHIPIQKRSNECFRCNQKLYSYFNKKDFYAYDKQVCESCWNNLKRNIINTPL